MSTALVAAGASVTLPDVKPAPQDLLTAARKVAQAGIQNQAQAEACLKLLSVVKALEGQIEDAFGPAVKAAHEAHKQILAARGAHSDVLEEAEKLIRAAVNRWVSLQKEAGEDAGMAGVTTRNTWKYVVEDLSQVPREFLMLDEKKVTAVVKAMKGQTAIPGIRAFEEASIAVKRSGAGDDEW